jgi:S1-C subfamily serine protease
MKLATTPRRIALAVLALAAAAGIAVAAHSHSARAAAVDPGLVDINTSLGYQGTHAAGTGIVLTSSGEVLTNNHVIRGATRITATDLGNGRTYTARVVGYSVPNDVAVLQLQGASGLSRSATPSRRSATPAAAAGRRRPRPAGSPD